ncbi:hypothetical protein DH2020_030603 [Rehmannia glutinosa]|uniref:Uncharacterized protein n=1 Tax=Rehmannia glutinosa TaxID=99300 RepID=A0ABR0VKK5_REHGL
MNLLDVHPALLISSALILTLSILCSLIKLIKSSSNTNTPPGPRGFPIVGYLPFLRRDLHHLLTELSHQYGPIFKLRLGDKLWIVINSPSLLKEVRRDHDIIFANRDITVAARIITYGLNDIAWSPYGSQWRSLRKIFVREMLSNNNLKATYNLRKDEVRKVVREIYSKIGTPIDICELTMQIDLCLIINLIWGGKIEAKRRDKILAGILPVVAEILDLLIEPNISDFFPVLARFDIQGVAKEATTLLQRVDEIIEDTIHEWMKNPHDKPLTNDGRTDFMQILVDLMQEEDNKASLGKIQIKALIVDILVAGTDTSATAIEWAMTELLNHPEMMEKVQQELNEVVGLNNIVEEFHIPKLDYLDAVLKETLRMHPVLPLSPRNPSQSCTVGGYTIPKGSTVLVNIWSVQMDPLAWDNPSEFRPERFLGNNGKWDFSGNDLNYIPFGSGRRACAGIPLAERMVRYILASFLHSYEWRLPDEEKLDMSDKLLTTLRKRIPLIVVPAPRLSRSDLYE